MDLSTLLYLLINYFGNEKFVKSLIVFNCVDQHSNFELSIRLSSNSFTVLILPLNIHTNSSSVANLMLFSEGLDSMGFFLDYNCASSEKIIDSVRKKQTF